MTDEKNIKLNADEILRLKRLEDNNKCRDCNNLKIENFDLCADCVNKPFQQEELDFLRKEYDRLKRLDENVKREIEELKSLVETKHGINYQVKQSIELLESLEK